MLSFLQTFWCDFQICRLPSSTHRILTFYPKSAQTPSNRAHFWQLASTASAFCFCLVSRAISLFLPRATPLFSFFCLTAVANWFFFSFYFVWWWQTQKNTIQKVVIPSAEPKKWISRDILRICVAFLRCFPVIAAVVDKRLWHCSRSRKRKTKEFSTGAARGGTSSAGDAFRNWDDQRGTMEYYAIYLPYKEPDVCECAISHLLPPIKTSKVAKEFRPESIFGGGPSPECRATHSCTAFHSTHWSRGVFYFQPSRASTRTRRRHSRCSKRTRRPGWKRSGPARRPSTSIWTGRRNRRRRRRAAWWWVRPRKRHRWRPATGTIC